MKKDLVLIMNVAFFLALITFVAEHGQDKTATSGGLFLILLWLAGYFITLFTLKDWR